MSKCDSKWTIVNKISLDRIFETLEGVVPIENALKSKTNGTAECNCGRKLWEMHIEIVK